MTKAALYSEKGEELSVASVETEVLISRPDFAERDMEAMRLAVFGTIKNVIDNTGVEASDISGIACCGHGKGLYLLGRDGKPFRNAILSTDNRACAYQMSWERDGTEAKAFQLSLQHVMACQPVALLAWLKDNEPEALEQAKWILACKDYVRYCLTGEVYGEYTDFSGMHFLNLHTKAYDRELLACFGLQEVFETLPPLRRSTDICGCISAEAAAATGLKEGTPVAGGMFDIDACALAVNAAREDKLCAIAGTWSINEYIRKDPVADGSVRMNSIFCDPSYYLIEESSATSAGNNEWFVRTLLPELRSAAKAAGGSVYEECNRLVSSIPPGEFSPIFLPFLFASNVNPNAKGTILGIAGYHTRAHIVRSIYEGIVFCHRYHIDKLLKSRTLPVSSIQLAGGVAQSDVWSQMFADVMQLPVETMNVKETGALGCAITAATAAGAYPSLLQAAEAMTSVKARYAPNPENASAYESRYALYCRAIEALDPIWSGIQAQL